MEILIALFVAMIPFAVVTACVTLMRSHAGKKSRLPFNYAEMARPPGFSLLQSNRSLITDFTMYILLATIYFLLPFSIPTILGSLNIHKLEASWWAYSSVFFMGSVYSSYRSMQAFKQAMNVRLGMEAEWAVANTLAKITDTDVRVFHDIQGPNFNIDHVLTYPGGVIAIETKGRRKPNQKDNKNTHKLLVSGDSLLYPHYNDIETIPQATRQAQWLSKNLSSSTGLVIKSRPLVVVPGWYIEYKEKPIMPVLSHNNFIKNYRTTSKILFDNAELTRINHQLELLCRRMSEDF